MRYEQLRQKAHSGDVLMLERRGLVSVLVRSLTAQQISHVALLLWIGGTLWVAEMREFRGYVLTPASLWVDDHLNGARLYFGRAPDAVRARPDVVAREALNYRGRRYGYLSLVRVWAQQIIPMRRRTRGIVCSTFVARVWEDCGVTLRRTPAPGEFLRLSQSTTRMTREE